VQDVILKFHFYSNESNSIWSKSNILMYRIEAPKKFLIPIIGIYICVLKENNR